MTKEDYLQHIWTELEKGVSQKDHPFRFGTLATLVDQNELKQRTLVLRKVDNNSLLFYTDFRSNKVSQIIRNSAGSLLFYHPEKSLQLSLKGTVSIHTKGAQWEKHREQISEKSRDDYNTKHAPGTITATPGDLQRNSELNFCVLEFEILAIDYLQLNREQDHIRLIFNRIANTWKGDFVVP